MSLDTPGFFVNMFLDDIDLTNICTVRLGHMIKYLNSAKVDFLLGNPLVPELKITQNRIFGKFMKPRIVINGVSV